MRKIFSWILTSIIFVVALYLIWYTIKGYFMISIKDGVMFDGLGRKVTRSPFWFEMIFRQDTWPGIKSTLFDVLRFWIIAAILFAMGSLVKKINEPS